MANLPVFYLTNPFFLSFCLPAKPEKSPIYSSISHSNVRSCSGHTDRQRNGLTSAAIKDFSVGSTHTHTHTHTNTHTEHRRDEKMIFFRGTSVP